jgi:hypothetical protein
MLVLVLVLVLVLDLEEYKTVDCWDVKKVAMGQTVADCTIVEEQVVAVEEEGVVVVVVVDQHNCQNFAFS